MEKLARLRNPLERLTRGVDFELLRDMLAHGLAKLAKGKGGRPPYDYILIFNILILQRYYNLSDFRGSFFCKAYLEVRTFKVSFEDYNF